MFETIENPEGIILVKFIVSSKVKVKDPLRLKSNEVRVGGVRSGVKESA